MALARELSVEINEQVNKLIHVAKDVGCSRLAVFKICSKYVPKEKV